MSATGVGGLEELESLRRALAEAQAKVRTLEAENEAMERQRQEMEQRLEELEHQLKLLKRCLFGSRSEKVNTEELEARIAEHAREVAQAVADSKRPDEPPAEAGEEKARPRPKGDGKKTQKKARPHWRNPLADHLTRSRVEH